MKSKLSLTAILGASALTTGVLFAMPAVSCPFKQVKDSSLIQALHEIKFNQLNPLQIGMLGIGGTAAVATTGWLVANKLKGTTDSTAAASEDLVS